jgi:hypothetical protein
MKLNIPVFYYKFGNYVLDDWNIQFPNSLPENLHGVQSAPYKIAAMPILLQGNKTDLFLDLDCMPSDAPEDRKRLSTPIDLSVFDLVIMSDYEYASVRDIEHAVKKYKIKNYLVALGGLVGNENIDASHMLYRPWWSFNVRRENLYQDTNQKDKPYMFDVLLGSRRWHRDFIVKEFITSGLADQSIITYRNLYKVQNVQEYNRDHDQNFPDVKIQYPYVNANYNKKWEIPATSNGLFPIVGIPWEIYRHTNYTILSESQYRTDIFFMSEKTAKPIWAKRLFVVFAVAGFLKKLRQLGFKTFHSVIDETYDDEPDAEKRFSLAFDQVKYLHTQDPEKIHAKIQSIVEHNHVRLYNLQQEAQQQMHKMLLSTIPSQFIDL